LAEAGTPQRALQPIRHSDGVLSIEARWLAQPDGQQRASPNPSRLRRARRPAIPRGEVIHEKPGLSPYALGELSGLPRRPDLGGAATERVAALAWHEAFTSCTAELTRLIEQLMRLLFHALNMSTQNGLSSLAEKSRNVTAKRYR
jgi:hypothetical protein